MINNKYVSNIGWLFSDIVVRLGVSFFLSVIVARYMGVENFGLYSYLLAVFSIFIAVSSLGMNGVVVRELVLQSNSANILGSALQLQKIGAILSSIILTFWAFFVSDSKPENFLLIFFLILPTLLIQSANVYKYWFEYKVKSKYSVIAQNTSILIGLVLKLLLIGLNFNFIWVIAVTIVEQLVLVFLLWLFFKKNYKESLFVTKKVCIDLLGKSWPLILSGLAFILYIRLDQIMIGEILGVGQVGVFSVAVKFVEVSFFIPVIIMSTFSSMLVGLREKSLINYNKKMQLIYDIVSIFGYFLIIFIFIFGHYIIKYTFGLEYMDAVFQLKIYAIVILFYFFNSVSGRWYINEGLQKLAFFRNIFGLIVAFILNIIFIPKFGLTGASVSTVVSYIIAAYLYDLVDPRTRFVFFQKTRAIFLPGAIYRVRMEYLKK